MLRHHQHPAAPQGLSPPRCPVTRARQAQERLRACRRAPALPAVGRLKHEQIKRRQDCARVVARQPYPPLADSNTSKSNTGETVRVPLTRRWPTPTRPFPLLPSTSLCCPSLCCPSLCCPSLCCPSLPCGLAPARICAPSVHSARIGSTPTRPFPLLPFPSCLRTIRSLCTHLRTIRSLCTHRIDANTSLPFAALPFLSAHHSLTRQPRRAHARCRYV